MSSQIEDIEKRLKAIEDSIKELKETDSFIAKQVVGHVAAAVLNIAGRTMRGEKRKRFRDLFSEEKGEALSKRITEAKTPKKAFSILEELGREIAEFVTATRVSTADEAMDIAHSFIKKYSPVALPLKAERQDDVWLVDVDVGALAVKVAKVEVDARTGDIVSYEIPTKESNKAK